MDNLNSNPQVLEQAEFNLTVKEQKRKKYNRSVLFACYFLAFFSAVCFAFLFIAFLFLNTFNVFTIPFSFTGVINWIDALPSKSIVNPIGQLIEVIFAGVALSSFLGIVIYLIVCLVKIVRTLIKLCDISVNELDPKALTVKVLTLIKRAFTRVFGLIFLFCTTSLVLPVITYVLICVFFLLAILETTLKALYLFFDFETNKFEKKQFALALTRRFMVLLSLAILVKLMLLPYLSFAGSINQLKTITFTYISQLILLPLFKYFLFLLCSKMLLDAINYGGYDLNENNMTFYGQSFSSNTTGIYYHRKLRAKSGFLIFLVIFTLTFELAVFFIGLPTSFKINKHLDYVIETVCKYLFIVLIVIATRIVEKTPVKFSNKTLID